jgi:hypothetical protein
MISNSWDSNFTLKKHNYKRWIIILLNVIMVPFQSNVCIIFITINKCFLLFLLWLHPITKNTSFSWKNLPKKWTIVNSDIMATNLSKSSTSNNNCRVLLMAWKLKCISKFTFISNVWYYSNTFFVGDNIDIHLDFMFHSNLLPSISIISTNLSFKWHFKLLQKNWWKH